MCRHIQREVVGLARQAVRLIIKNVWDFPEMQRRKIRPTDDEREKTTSELDLIIASSKRILDNQQEL